MSEKRFTYFKVPIGFGKQAIKDNANDEVFDFTLSNVLDKLNEQQAKIQELERKVKKYAKVGEEQLKQIIELQDKLKEKEEDEQLYANEIVELRKTNKEWLQFKELGGDY